MFTRTQKKEKRKEKKSAAMTSRKIEEDMAQKLSREAKNTLGHNKDSHTHTHTHTLCSTTVLGRYRGASDRSYISRRCIRGQAGLRYV